MSKETFQPSRLKEAMDELMKSEEGRELAENLRTKLKEMNEQFKDLSGEDKQKFVNEFRNKFADSLGNLQANLKQGNEENDEFRFQNDEKSSFDSFNASTNYWPFLIAIFVILLIFGILITLED